MHASCCYKTHCTSDKVHSTVTERLQLLQLPLLMLVLLGDWHLQVLHTWAAVVTPLER
jgi:hypothetical protein